MSAPPNEHIMKSNETQRRNKIQQQIEERQMIDDVVKSGTRRVKRNALLNPAWLPLKSAEEPRAKKGSKCKCCSTDTSETEQIDVEKNLDIPAKTKCMKMPLPTSTTWKVSKLYKSNAQKHFMLLCMSYININQPIAIPKKSGKRLNPVMDLSKYMTAD
ncbi:hypothetical protein BDQ17DRAFT_1431922 [Cyathus striatus]|nr:hypothetical protein BDQ17DRAFT_1431922 [Cyathus striatus]